MFCEHWQTDCNTHKEDDMENKNKTGGNPLLYFKTYYKVTRIKERVLVK